MNTLLLTNRTEADSRTDRHFDKGFLSNLILTDQNRRFKGTGGVSHQNRAHGFLPAFRDGRTGTVHLSRFADGRVAPVHLLDGLPMELVTKKTSSGRVIEVNKSVIAGFLLGDKFYTRDEAAKAIKPNPVASKAPVHETSAVQ